MKKKATKARKDTQKHSSENEKDVKFLFKLIDVFEERANSLLKAKEQRVKRIISKLGNLDSIETMLKAVKHKNQDVREQALKKLSEMLKPGDKVDTDILLNALNDESSNVRLRAARVLSKMKEKRALDPIITMMEHDKNEDCRFWAAGSLGSIDNPAALAPLSRALESDEHRVRTSAMDSLAEMSDPRALTILIKYLNEGKSMDKGYYLDVAWSLAHSKKPRAFQALLKAMHSKNKEKRATATGALKMMGDLKVAEPLINALRDNYHEVRKYAAFGLAELARLEEKKLKKSKKHMSFVKNAEEPLKYLLKDKNIGVRINALHALAAIGSPDVSELLIKSLQENDEWFRYYAASKLGELKVTKALEPLINLLKDESELVIGAAISALVKLGDKRAIEPLRTLLEHENEEVKRNVASALKSLSKRIIAGNKTC